jgi:hypothetical protein
MPMQAATDLFYLQASFNDGIWTLEIKKVGHDDGGVYECQTNTEIKTSVSVQLNIMGKILKSFLTSVQWGSKFHTCAIFRSFKLVQKSIGFQP